MDIADNGMNEAIVFSPLLEEHIRKHHPNMKITSSTCKQIRDLPTLESELEKDYSLVVLDYNYNNDFDTLAKIPHKEKCEILVNAVCTPNCQRRGEHYRYIGKYQLEHCNPAELAKIQAGTAKVEEWQCPHMKNNAFTRRNSPLHVSPQARTNYSFNLICPHQCKGDTTRWKGKLKPGQKTAFPFPLMVSPLHTSSLHPYSLPFFIPLRFACRRRPNPFHLFVPFSIAMFSGWSFNPFFYLLFFG